MTQQKIIVNDYPRKLTDDQIFTSMGHGIKGHVTAVDKVTGEVLADTDNLILYKGREWLAQRAVNIKSPAWETAGKDGYITHFGLGTGGASPGDILTPLVPNATDVDLLSPCMLNNAETSYITRQKSGNNYQIKPISSVSFVPDISNGNRYVIIQLQTNISLTDANGPNGNASYDLNEAALFVTKGENPDPIEDISIFARCTFSTIRKVVAREISFIWNIYF